MMYSSVCVSVPGLKISLYLSDRPGADQPVFGLYELLRSCCLQVLSDKTPSEVVSSTVESMRACKSEVLVSRGDVLTVLVHSSNDNKQDNVIFNI